MLKGGEVFVKRNVLLFRGSNFEGNYESCHINIDNSSPNVRVKLAIMCNRSNQSTMHSIYMKYMNACNFILAINKEITYAIINI